jgi:hypothetical protein
VKKILFFSAIILSVFVGRAQVISPRDMEKFQIMEDSLLVTADSMYNAPIPDFRLDYCEQFARQLVRTLKIPNSYLYPFSKISKKINIIYSDDTTFRIFNWAIIPTAATKRYYAAIQMPSEKLKLYGLHDYTEQMGKGAADSVLNGGMWFGALYYRVISRQVNGRKVYFLFGLNAGSIVSNKKVIDPLTIDEKGITFGGPLFGFASENFAKRPVNRFILEYKKDVQASLNWNPEMQLIVFDNLTSQINDPLRKYTYVPTGRYDGFKWYEGMWQYVRDVMPVTILKDGEAPSEPVMKIVKPPVNGEER